MPVAVTYLTDHASKGVESFPLGVPARNPDVRIGRFPRSLEPNCLHLRDASLLTDVTAIWRPHKMDY
jgi:hypothetical protein